MAPTAVIHIICAIVVAEHKLVDRLCTVYDVANERFAESILVWAFGTVGNGDADTAYFAFMHIVGTKEQVVFVVFLHYCRSPHCAAGPAHVGLFEYAWMFGPVHQVGR